MGKEGVGDFILKKLSELLILLENFVAYVVEKVNEAFPAETRSEQLKHWLHVAAPWVLGLVLLLLCFRCCRSCCCRCCKTWNILKMMKASGRNYRMPRHAFESNPRSYFRDLRGKSIVLD
ncbi:hypothetical protein ACLOJK_038145 [Asimina triloba]